MRQKGILRAFLAVSCLISLAHGQQMTGESASTPAFAVGFDAATTATSRTAYTDGSASLLGYLAYDNSTSEVRPAVVILPDWDGIGPYEEWRAHLLATLGYVGFVADIYSTSILQGPTLPQANRSALTSEFSSDPAMYVERIHAALDHVRTLDIVDVTKLAVIGYCFGGSGVIHLHRSYPNDTEGVLGVVGFHSAIPSMFATAPVQNNPIEALFFNGYNDQGNNPTTVGAFESVLNGTNATWNFVQFGQTVHAFTEPTMAIVDTNDPSTNMGYNPSSDVLSWWTMRGFLRDLFDNDMLYSNETWSSNPYTEEVMPGISVS